MNSHEKVLNLIRILESEGTYTAYVVMYIGGNLRTNYVYFKTENNANQYADRLRKDYYKGIRVFTDQVKQWEWNEIDDTPNGYRTYR